MHQFYASKDFFILKAKHRKHDYSDKRIIRDDQSSKKDRKNPFPSIRESEFLKKIYIPFFVCVCVFDHSFD